MKRILTLFVTLLFAMTVFAQSPQKMSYQAVIRNSSDQLVTNHVVRMRISILQGSSNGTAVYVETQNATTNANGLVSIEIGGGAIISGTFAGINWSTGTYFIKTETDPTGGTSYTITGTSQLLSVPYALSAYTVASYPEIDPVFEAHAASGITSIIIGNWNTAYGWGNHSGLYRSLSYVPAWNEITNNPFNFNSPINNQLLKYNITSSKWENWTPNFLTSYAETDPIWTAISANYYTKANMQTSGQSQLHFNNLTDKPTTVAGYGIIDAVTTMGNQTISGNKTFSGKTSVITPVDATDAANKVYVDGLKSQIEELQILAGIRVKDIDGNLYKTVTIGTQIWMAENLKTIRYNDGTAIPLVTDNTAWAALVTPAYCWYNNDEATYKAIYGAYYNWYAVDAVSNGGKNICPIGWHVPTDAQWTALSTYLTNNSYGYEGSGDDIGKSLASTSGWTPSTTAGTVGNDQPSNNRTGFTALSSGYRGNNGIFGYIGNSTIFWSSNQSFSQFAWSRFIYYDNPNLVSMNTIMFSGYSVRCLRD